MTDKDVFELVGQVVAAANKLEALTRELQELVESNRVRTDKEDAEREISER